MVQIPTKQNIMFFSLCGDLPTNTDKVNSVFPELNGRNSGSILSSQAFFAPRLSLPLTLFIQKLASSILRRMAITK